VSSWEGVTENSGFLLRFSEWLEKREAVLIF